MYIKNKKTGEISYTLSMAVYGFIAVTIKLMIAGLTIGGFKMSEFTGIDYAAAVAALGGVYQWGKMQRKPKEEDKGETNG